MQTLFLFSQVDEDLAILDPPQKSHVRFLSLLYFLPVQLFFFFLFCCLLSDQSFFLFRRLSSPLARRTPAFSPPGADHRYEKSIFGPLPSRNFPPFLTTTPPSLSLDIRPPAETRAPCNSLLPPCRAISFAVSILVICSLSAFLRFFPHLPFPASAVLPSPRFANPANSSFFGLGSRQQPVSVGFPLLRFFRPLTGSTFPCLRDGEDFAVFAPSFFQRFGVVFFFHLDSLSADSTHFFIPKPPSLS